MTKKFQSIALTAAGVSLFSCGDSSDALAHRENFTPPTGEGSVEQKEEATPVASVATDEPATPSVEKTEETQEVMVDRGPLPAEEFLPVTKQVYENLKKEESPFEAYDEKLADQGSITMVPIQAGTFMMGSPDAEEGRSSDEGPQRKVEVGAFWMSETEVTWALYRAFMENGDARSKDGSLKRASGDEALATVVSQPTPPYTPMHFDMGGGDYADEYPAIGMTQHAASKFCEWLSAQTGHYYRLATEAEWEYAARAGSTTAYFFGDDPAELGDYAWFADNSDFEYQPVKLKKPNPWGLYDIPGNVAEWVLDRYTEDGYAEIKEGEKNPWQAAEDRYPRAVRGGHWDQDPVDLRSAARMASSADWKVQDPQIPKSIWYHTDALWLGFRIVRPVRTPSLEDTHRYWNTGPGEAE